MTEINTHGMTMPAGIHKGERITRIPVGYLKWMVNSRHTHADIAAAELARRGTTTPDLDVSGHALDRASLLCRKQWHDTRRKDEGLHSWLCRVAREALDRDTLNKRGRHVHVGLQFVFETETVWPVLKTVMPVRKNSDAV